MGLTNNPGENIERTTDILKNNTYNSITKNISNKFEYQYPGYNLIKFLENKPSSPLEIKVYKEYKKIVDRVPDIHTLFSKQNKSVEDYTLLLSNENIVFFNNEQKNTLIDEGKQANILQSKKYLESLGLNKYTNIIDQTEALKISNIGEVTLLLNLLNKLSPQTIISLEKINKGGNIELNTKDLSFIELKTITQINALVVVNMKNFRNIITINYKKLFNTLSKVSIKNGVVDINRYYSYTQTEDGLRAITHKKEKTSEVYIDYKQQNLNFPYKAESSEFFDEHSNNIQKLLSGEITGKNREALIKIIKEDFKKVIEKAKEEYGYIPWELQEYSDKIDTLGKPNKKLIEFLELFKVYLRSGVETGIGKGSNSGDSENIEKTNKLISQIKGGSINKLNQTQEGFLFFDSLLEDRLEDFYEYLQEGLEYNLGSTHEVENDGSSMFNSDLTNIDNFIEKFHFGGKDEFNFNKLKMSLAINMVEQKISPIEGSTNLYEGWNLVRANIIDEVDNANSDTDLKQEIESKYNKRIQEKNNTFSTSEVESFKKQMRQISLFTQEAILNNAQIEYNPNDISDIENKLIKFFISNARNVGIRYATEQEVIRIYGDTESIELKPLSGTKQFLETFNDDWRGVKEIIKLVSTEAIKFAIATILTAGAGGVVAVFARGGGYVAQGINAVGKVGSSLHQAGKQGGIIGNSAKLALGTVKVGADVASYTFISNWVDNGEFSMDHFVENFALIGGGIAGLRVGGKLGEIVNKSDSKFKEVLSKYLGATSGSMAGQLTVRFNDGTEIDFLDLLTQSAIMGTMMLPMMMGKRVGLKTGDSIQGGLNRVSPGRIGNNTGKTKLGELGKREQLRNTNLQIAKTKYSQETNKLFKEVNNLRDSNLLFRVGGPKIGTHKTTYLKVHYEGLNGGFNYIKNFKNNKELKSHFFNRIESSHGQNFTINQLQKKLSNKKVEFKKDPNNATIKSELKTLEQDFAIWKSIESGQGISYFNNKLFKIIDSPLVNKQAIAKLPEAHPLKRMVGEVTNAGSRIKEGTVLGAKSTKEIIPAKVLHARRSSMEWGQYAGEGKRIRDKSGNYEGFNIITDKVEGQVLKLKGVEVAGIPKGHNVKSVELISNVNGGNLYIIKIKEPGLKGKTYEANIYESHLLNPKLSRIAIENRGSLKSIKKANGDIAYYTIKSGDNTKYYSRRGTEISKPSKNKDLSKSKPIIEAKDLTPKEKIQIKERAQNLGKILFTNKSKYITKFGNGTVNQTMKLLGWIVNNPGKTIVWGLIGGGSYYYLSGKAEEHLNSATDNINQRIDNATEDINESVLELLLKEVKEKASELIPFIGDEE